MKNLYNCSATCDSNKLNSYNTTVCYYDSEKEKIFLYLYRSQTTLSHIRKYVKWLNEKYLSKRANIIKAVYNYGIRFKSVYLEYDCKNGNFYEITREQSPLAYGVKIYD